MTVLLKFEKCFNSRQDYTILALICAPHAPMFCHLEFAILISPIARFNFDNSRSTRENRLYLECSIYKRDMKLKYRYSNQKHESRFSEMSKEKKAVIILIK